MYLLQLFVTHMPYHLKEGIELFYVLCALADKESERK